MSPEQLKIEELEKKVIELERFMNNLKSAATIDPQVPRAINLRNQFVSKGTVGDTTGILKAVSEGGAGNYNVADAFDGSIIITDANAVQYKLGYYTV